MQIFPHGNKKNYKKGYSIIESIVCIAVTSILLIVVLGMYKNFVKTSYTTKKAVENIIETKNEHTHRMIESLK